MGRLNKKFKLLLDKNLNGINKDIYIYEERLRQKDIAGTDKIDVLKKLQILHTSQCVAEGFLEGAITLEMYIRIKAISDSISDSESQLLKTAFDKALGASDRGSCWLCGADLHIKYNRNLLLNMDTVNTVPHSSNLCKECFNEISMIERG